MRNAFAGNEIDGAEGETRTLDLTITNRLLYQLSYLGSASSQCSIRRKTVSNTGSLGQR